MFLGNQDPRPQVSGQQPQSTFVDPGTQAVHSRPSKSKRMAKLNIKSLTNSLVILTGVLIILIVVALLFYKNNSENSYVNNSTYQSVDINVAGSTGGQIYFGQIKSL
ncbi:MAG TPA: hypothetical protein VII94_05050, partial [Candidatus Saccharimonadales bacterium]